MIKWHVLKCISSMKTRLKYLKFLSLFLKDLSTNGDNSKSYLIHVTASQAIRWRIEKRLDAWAEGKHTMLVVETLRTCADYLHVARREETAEHWAQTYHILVLRGKLQTAVRWITERETGGILQPGDRCTKTGDQVMEVLYVKHPEARTPTGAILDLYPNRPPKLSPVDITDDMLTVVAGRLLGGAGPGGTDSIFL